MVETLANGDSSESTRRELSNEYQHDRVQISYQKSLHLSALDESSIGRVNNGLLVAFPRYCPHIRQPFLLQK